MRGAFGAVNNDLSFPIAVVIDKLTLTCADPSFPIRLIPTVPIELSIFRCLARVKCHKCTCFGFVARCALKGAGGFDNDFYRRKESVIFSAEGIGTVSTTRDPLSMEADGLRRSFTTLDLDRREICSIRKR